MFQLWCEWDFGQENYIFASKQAAYNWLKNSQAFKDMLEDDETFESLLAENLIGVKEVKVIQE